MLRSVVERMRGGERVRVVGVAVCVVCVLVWRWRRTHTPRTPSHTPQDVKKKPKVGNPLSVLWRLLVPRKWAFWRSEDGSEGAVQILVMLVLCVVRVYLMNETSNLVGALDKVMMTRNQRDFWRFWSLSLGIAFAASVHRQTYRYVESSLGAVWQTKLTSLFHTLYFRNMNYYTLSQGAANRSEECVPDVVERLTSDVKEVTQQMSLILCEGMYTATAGGFFAYKLGRLYGAQFAVAPYVYLWLSFVLTQKLFPMNWPKIFGELKSKFSVFKTSLDHINVHHEAIRSLEGSQFESKNLTSSFQTWMESVRGFNKKVILSGFADQLAFHWWLRTFVSWFVLGPHVLSVRKKRDLTSLSDLADLRGAIGHQFVLFIQSMIAAGVSAKMLRQLQQLAASARRVAELFVKLKDIDVSHDKHSLSSLLPAPHIEFKDVEVETPTGELLVSDLNFRVEIGQSLLLTGHNGAGKSSIFRCLGGLWKIKHGLVMKPGSVENGLHQDVYYLPQKPYNVIGTLRDQITYPEIKGNADALTEDQLKRILEKVQLEYLMSVPGALTDDIDWSSCLSLGEQQRLSVARLIYHKPKYAILDECTSAVSTKMEKRLYALCAQLNISYITISHRPVLQAYHTHLLTIGLGDGRYSLTTLQREVNLENFAESESKHQNASGGEAESGESEIGENDNDKIDREKSVFEEKKMTKSSFFGSVRKMVRLLRLCGFGNKFPLKILTYFFGVLVQSKLLVSQTSTVSLMMGCIFSQRSDKFRRFLECCAHGSLLALALAAVEQIQLYLKRTLCTDINQSLGDHLISRYMSHNNFDELAQLFPDSDPVQMISEDVKQFASRFTDLLPLLQPITEIGWFMVKVHQLVGSFSTSFFSLYLLVSSFALRVAFPNFTSLSAKESELEGKFVTSHSRVQTHAESIAFFGGGAREREITERHFSNLMALIWERLRVNMSFGLLNQFVVREAPMLVQWILRNEYGKQWGDDQQLQKDSGQQLNQAQLFLFNATNIVFDAVGQILNAGEFIATLFGSVERIHLLNERLLHCSSVYSKQEEVIGGMRSFDAQQIGLENVSLVTPKGRKLATHLSLQITSETPLLVTGPNGSGKTFLARCLGGMWPPASGRLTLPELAVRRQMVHANDRAIFGVFIVPQKVYMAQGSLADQITYPLHLLPSFRTSEEEEHLRTLMELVGVGYLVDREGWDVTMKWQDILSLGEQQRIGMARLFYHRPQFGILDECTSAVSVDVEEKLYRAAKEIGITCITISQRLALQEFHTQELRLGETNLNKWSLHSLNLSKEEE